MAYFRRQKMRKLKIIWSPPPKRFSIFTFFDFQIVLLICCELIAKTLYLKHDMLTVHSRWVSALELNFISMSLVYLLSVVIPKLSSEFKKMFLTPLVTGNIWANISRAAENIFTLAHFRKFSLSMDKIFRLYGQNFLSTYLLLDKIKKKCKLFQKIWS